MKQNLLFLLAVVVWSSLGMLWGQEPDSEKLRHAEFAGIWFYSAIQKDTTRKQFPVGYVYGPSASQEVGRDNISVLHQSMRDALLKERRSGGNRIVDCMSADPEADFANSATDDSIVFACALNYEHAETQYESGAGKAYSKVLTEIGFDLVVCNFKDRRILATLPGRIVAIDAVPGKAGAAKCHSMLKYLYEKKLVPEFVSLAKAPYSSAMAAKTLGISKLQVSPKALKEMPSHYKAAGERGYAAYVSSLVSSSFYAAVKVPVLPYSGGGDKIYYVMSERIKDSGRVSDEAMKDNSSLSAEDGEVESGGVSKDFLLKKPDYELELVFPGFIAQTMQANQFQKQVAFVAYCGLRIRSKGNEVLAERYKDAVTSIYPTKIQLSSNWINFEDATIKMLRSAAKSLKNHKKSRSIIQQTSLSK